MALPAVGSGAVGTQRAMLQLQGHGSQEEPGPQVMAAHAPKSGQGGRVSLRHWHSGPVESNSKSLRHSISMAFYILKLKTIYMAFTWSWKRCCWHAPGDITVTRTWLTGEAWSTGYRCACSKVRTRWQRFVAALTSLACRVKQNRTFVKLSILTALYI